MRVFCNDDLDPVMMILTSRSTAVYHTEIFYPPVYWCVLTILLYSIIGNFLSIIGETFRIPYSGKFLRGEILTDNDFSNI